MRFGVLGPLAVWTDAGESVAIPGLKVRALLADLLVSEGHVVSADRLVDDLWSGEPPGNPAGALQVRVSQLRRALEDAEPGGKNLVVSRAPGYLLQAGPGTVDAARFTDLVARAETADGPRATAALLAEALGLWRGAAFADFADEDFTRAAIVRLEEQRLAALERHAEARLELGEHGLLAGELGDLVARHPLRERLRAVHMRALYRAGRQSEALASYTELRERLAEELGLDPGRELAELYQAILGQDPALSAAAELPPTNLPAPVSRLIGRDDAVAEVAALLEDERLVTLTGSGGVGKTRLALEVAHRLSGAYADGAWLVELAALDHATGSPAEAVMEALGIREGTEGAAPAARLSEALRARELLLVLDNCEHVVERVAELAEALLRAVPGMRVLATSREPLALPGETLWSVPPLGVPDLTAFDAVLGASPAVALAAAEGSDAVRLFVARAAASTRGFALDADNAEAVVRLCRRLDGIPLALELAATRVRALGVRGVVARLDDRFRLLAAGHRGAPARQQTLTAVIDWSWNLLTPPERVVLRRLAVHADGCTLEAAQKVCAGDHLDELAELDVIDVLARLVDRSLVVVVEGAAGVRYRLLESVSEYCLDRLAEAGELEDVRRAHARHHLALAEQAEPALYGHDQRAWLQRLDAEAANLRAALETAARGHDADTAIRLVNALSWYWYLRGRPGEARRSLETALALHGEAPGRARAAAWRAGFTMILGDEATWDTAAVADPRERARAELFLGMATSDLPTAQELVGGALTTFRAIGDEWGVAAALSKRARDAFTARDVVALERDSEESVRLFDKLGDRWGLLQATEWLAGLAAMKGDADAASRLFEDGLRVAEELGMGNEAARRTAWLGWNALQSGDYEQAMELCGRALRLSVEQGFREGTVMAEMGLAFAARRAGRLDVAERHLLHLLEGVPRHPDAEPALHLPSTLVELGYLRERLGDAEQARALHQEALTAAQRVGDPATVASAVDGVASALAALGSPERAARLLGLAAAAREASQMPAGPSQAEEIGRVVERVRAALGEEAFDALYEEGGRLKPADALGL
ncbi:winged helix-turn-helix domain-containing protein [Nonomuraea sp. SMC257]|uniref:Winged helix-turn-helix domain-containing protein n=1 Tax=Nonomuraea montanisoli TaxID=2741721 RepID=A0A7Y6I190_9ACTN|nr:BTAD domain-containing putative transcriptional regulator [Nonomuraea montanisoli]NUW29835.1 winged helix-turn-helix domain-containing protein [Nonomuraea montanisoli]